MGANIISSDANSVQGSSSISVPIPDNTADDKVFVLVSGIAASLSFNTPSGWSQVAPGQAVNGNHVSALFFRDGPVSGPLTITANQTCLEIAATSWIEADALAASFIDFAAKNTATGTSHPAAGSGQTTSETDVHVIAVYSTQRSFGGNEMTPPVTLEFNAENLTSYFHQVIASTVQGAAGSTGTPAATTPSSTTSANFLIGIKKTNRPSAPNLLKPDVNTKITEGTPYETRWTPGSSPLIAQSSLKYEISHSENGGASFSVITTTSAGAVSQSLTTTGWLVGSQHIIRIRTKDETNTLYSDYVDSPPFTVLDDLAPLAPTNLHAEQPSGTVVTVADLAAAIVVKGTFNDPGDTLTKFDLDWGTNGSSFPNTSSTTSGTFSKTYAGATFSAGVVYFRARTYDYANTPGPYAYFNITVGAKPSAPTITAPTAGSPPATPNPVASIAASTHSALRWYLLEGADEVVSATVVETTGLSFLVTYSLSDGVAYTLGVARRSSIGLWSAYDTETFTVSFTAPDVPTITATVNDEDGTVDLLVENTDTPDYNLIYATEDYENFILITPVTGIPINSVFKDRTARSGVEHSRGYLARAYDGDLFTQSDLLSLATATLALTHVHIHAVTRTSAISNGVDALTLLHDSIQERNGVAYTDFGLGGRGLEFIAFGESLTKVVTCQILWIHASEDVRAALEAMHEAGAILCYRDPFGNKLFNYLLRVPARDEINWSYYVLEFSASDYRENNEAVDLYVPGIIAP